jgi:hypothetical protein
MRTRPLSTHPRALLACVLCSALLIGCDQQVKAAEEPIEASSLLRNCAASDTGKQAYCHGYIEGTVHLWKIKTACESEPRGDSYCKGALKAREISTSVWEECADCDYAQFHPELSDETVRQERYRERMQEFAVQLRDALGGCSSDEQTDDRYCSGYSAEVRHSLAGNQALRFWLERPEDPYEAGLCDGERDMFLHLYAEAQMHDLVPCIPPLTSTRKLTETLLDFVDQDPDERRTSTATMLLARNARHGARYAASLVPATNASRQFQSSIGFWTNLPFKSISNPDKFC